MWTLPIRLALLHQTHLHHDYPVSQHDEHEDDNNDNDNLTNCTCSQLSADLMWHHEAAVDMINDT